MEAVAQKKKNKSRKKESLKQDHELKNVQIAEEAFVCQDEKEFNSGEQGTKEYHAKDQPMCSAPEMEDQKTENVSLDSISCISTNLASNEKEAHESIIIQEEHGADAASASYCDNKTESKHRTIVSSPAEVERKSSCENSSLYPELHDIAALNEQLLNLSLIGDIYPTLETIGIEQELMIYQTLVKTYTKTIENKATMDALTGYQEFTKEQICVDQHELFDLIRKYERVRQEAMDTQRKLKQNEYKLKTNKKKLWKTVTEKATAKGKCHDGNHVEFSQTFEYKVLDKDAIDDITEVFTELEETLLGDLAFYSYMDQLTRLQMELYIHELVSTSTIFADKTSSSPLAAYVVAMPPQQYKDEISSLRKCISVLFSFQRKPIHDPEFINFTRSCLIYLVALLLRSGRLEDNLFIINHVLRCPSGISTWAAQFVQLPLPPLKNEPTPLQSGSFESDYLDYNIAVLSMLMHYPAPDREKFLKHVKSATSPVNQQPSDATFIILDSDGEEIEEPFQIFKDWEEDDVIALLKQIPMSQIFRYILLFSSQDNYSVERTTEEGMQKLLAFSAFLVDVFCDGLKSYNYNFSSLTLRIGKLLRHTVHHVSDHWQNYKEVNYPIKCGLQAEFDRFFFHSVYTMFRIRETGAWKFLSGLPYENVSPRMLWNLLWIFHSSGTLEEEDLVYTEKNVDIKLKSVSVRLLLQIKFSTCNLDESLHLLNAIERMAASNVDDKEFTCCATKEILEVSMFNDELHHDELAKEGRVLVSSIADKHPCVISLLVKEIDARDDRAASMLLFLFKELSLLKWIPDPQDLQKISDWLLCGSLSSPKNRIARLILQKLNWENSKEPGHVYLPIELHRHVGVLVTQAYSLYDSSGDTWSVSKGIEQMLNLYATIKNQSVEYDQGFISWAWEMLFSLKLHVLDHPNPPWVQIYDGQVETDNIPHIHRDTWLHPLVRAVEDRTPAGSFLAVIMTNIGHSSKSIVKEGLDIICTLVEQKQYAAAIHLLYYVLPFFAKCPEELTSNQRFMLQMYDLIVADQSSFNIVSEPVVGTVLQNIESMIKHQVFQAWKLTVECASPLLKLWIQVLVKLLFLDDKIGLWQKLKGGNNQVYYLLDVVVQISFADNHTMEVIVELMSAITKPVLSLPNGSSRTSFYNLIFGCEKSSSLLPFFSLPEYPWFAWCVLVSECGQKQMQDLWLAVLNELSFDGAITVEVALKKAAASVKIVSPQLLNLPIYRWCMQAVDTPMNHPILPLLWQQFFLYYFQRTTNTSGVREGSVGQKFFVGSAHVKIVQKIKSKLKEAADHFHSCVEKAEEKLEALHNKPGASFSSKEEETLIQELTFHQELLFTFRAFSAWMEDPEIHKSSICLPALEPKYYAGRLKLIIENDQMSWVNQLMRIDSIKGKFLNNGSCWPHCRKKSLPAEVPVVKKTHITPTRRIKSRLDCYEDPLPLPPVRPLKPPVGDISDNMLASWDVLSRIVHSDQRIICDQAKNFRCLLNKVKQLDATYLSQVPKEYELISRNVQHRKPCYKGSNECVGQASFRLQIKNSKRNERVQEKIEHNRIEYQFALKEILKPPPPELCSAAMHMENCVRALVKKIKSSKGHNIETLKNMGISLFYLQLKLTQSAIASVSQYSPSRQFFSSSIELLGREFIEGEEDQCLPIAKAMLDYPAVAGLASPFFNPNSASPRIFLEVYDVLVKAVNSETSSAIIVMLSKIDLNKWLTEKNVGLAERKKLFTKIGKAVINCGREPKVEIVPVYEFFKRHYSILLQYQFPEHYDDAVQLLLSELEQKGLCVDIWYETFRCLGCSISTEETNLQEIKSSLQKFALNQHLPADQRLFVFTQPLHLKQVLDTVRYLNGYFVKMHANSPCDLYKKYKEYIRPIAIFLGMMGHCMMDFYSSRDFRLTEKPIDVEGLWRSVHLAFYMWLDPQTKAKHLIFPWEQEDLAEAKFMFEMFTSCIEFHHKQLYGKNCQRSILSLVWSYYVTVYVSPGLRNYSTVVCHSAMLDLPWKEFYPTAEDIHGMCTVLRSDIPESREFLAEFSIKIPWTDVMGHLTRTGAPAIVADTFLLLGELLLISAWEFSVIKTNSHKGVLKSLENLAWSVLSPEKVSTLLNLYTSLADPQKLLKDNADELPDVYMLKFHKLVCAMLPGFSNQPSSTEKRLLYISMYVKFLGKFVQENANAVLQCEEQFSRVLPTLLREIEIIIQKDIVSNEQVNSAIPLVREALGFLNYVEDTRLQDISRNSVTTWLKSSPRSPLLLPCLKSACCSLTSVGHVVSIVECCISARFDTELEDPAEAVTIWYILSSCFQVPPGMHDEFLTVCLQNNAHLTLYNYILHRLPQTSTEASKIMLLQNMVDWLKRTKPVENVEAKILLIWDKICELSLKLAAVNEQVVQNILISFCGVLSLLGEDRSQIGVLAVFGLGKQSLLTVNFRFLCRTMAAFLLLQMPEKGTLRLELLAPGFIRPANTESGSKQPYDSSSKAHPSSNALKALQNLKELTLNTSYSALKTQVDCAVNNCLNPRFCLRESRSLLKELALQVFPNHSYLHALDSQV